MLKHRNFIGALAAAWDMLLEQPRLPVARERSEEALNRNPRLVLWTFPVLGLLLGLALGLAGVLLWLIWPAERGAVIAFAVLVFLALELKDGGSTLVLTASLIQQRAGGKSWSGSVAQMSPSWSSLTSPPATLAILVLAVVKLAALTTVAWYHCWWFPAAALVLNFTVQGALATAPSIIDGTPMLAVARRERPEVWYVAAGALVIVLLLTQAVLAVLVAFVLCWFFCRGVKRFCRNFFSGVDANIISLAGGWAEVITLASALLLLMRQVPA